MKSEGGPQRQGTRTAQRPKHTGPEERAGIYASVRTSQQTPGATCTEQVEEECSRREHRALPLPGHFLRACWASARLWAVGVVSAGCTPGSPRGCGQSCAGSWGICAALPQAPRYPLWPEGGRAEMLRRTEAQGGGMKGPPDVSARTPAPCS